MTVKKQDYQALSGELDAILALLQEGQLDVDAALKQYERGLEITKLLDAYLKDAENRVTKLKSQFENVK